MNKSEAIIILTKHALSTMPDSSKEQEKLYRAIAVVLPSGNDQELAEHIAVTIAEANRLQLEFTKILGF